MNRKNKSLLSICFFLSCFCLSCGTLKNPYYSDNNLDWANHSPEPDRKLVHSLYLIGDGGELDDTIQNRNYVIDAASQLLQQEKGETSLVYLGDNVYPAGLPKKSHSYRNMAERILDAHLKLVNEHDGFTYFIPGNHDWNRHHKGGRKAILRQEKYIKEYFGDDNKKVKFYPKNACGDPKVVKIHKDLVYVFVDSQWWLQDWSQEKKMNHKCEIKSRADFLKRMEEIIADHKNDEIIILLHHPIKSNGKHGGKFNARHHLFPLTEANSKLWIPLPGIGSLYPIYRNVTGSKQDITHQKNKDLMEGLTGLAKKWRVNIMFLSGHDHGIQFFDDDKIKYVVSGGGSRRDYTQQGGDASYARDARGFAKIDFYENNEAWLNMYTVAGFDEDAILEYRTQLRTPRAGTLEEDEKFPGISEATITSTASDEFGAGTIKKLFLGAQYREIWETPVEAEVIDLETKLGGLTPIKKGGGMASNSLRMEHENGKQYILRSIKKDYTKLVPPEFSNLKLLDVIKDQNSASHPYNALIIPTLSKAANVYYTSPKLVYLKHQRGLGNYNSQFPEELYLLEERPSGDWSDAQQFGNSENIIGYADLLDILREKKNHFIDQRWVLKSRMFDLFIHDWDRHDDQWRWAHFNEDGKNIYRPIPRDRDQAFFKFKGIVPWYIATFMQKKFKGMKEDCKDAKNLSFNAKHFDRYFLHDLEWSEWKAVISELQNNVTDANIDDALAQFPKEIQNIKDTPQIGHLLKSRRDNLMKIGRRLYDFLAKEVEITGTDNKDRFEIVQSENGNLHIKSYVERKGKSDLLKYERIFNPTETKVVRLYGLRGKDNFVLTGSSNSSIKLHIIGGEDDDKVENTTGRNIFVYDDLKGMDTEGKVIDKRSSDLTVNEYDRHGFQYNTSLPVITFGNTVDDGWWFGSAVSWTTQGWRKDPYKSKQSFSFSFAPGSRDALQFGYKGHFPNSLGKLDFAPSIDVRFPHYENYFGLGSNTVNPLGEISYHWVRMQNIDINPNLRVGKGSSFLDFGPTFRYRNVSLNEGRVTEETPSFFTEDALASRKYLGAHAKYTLGFSDNKTNPSNGFFLSAQATHLIESAKNEDVTELDFNMRFYIQIAVRPKLVLASKLGYMRSYGDQQFYHYPAIGNNRGLRGFRNERYRGESAFYHNIDLRLKLFKWNNSIIPMDVGILAGYDYGKVSMGLATQNPFRTSRTVGVWMELLGAMVLQPYYTFNEEQNTFSLQLGFNF